MHLIKFAIFIWEDGTNYTFPALKKQAEMLLLSNVQVNTDFGTYIMRMQKDPPAKPQYLSSAAVQLLSAQVPQSVQP